MPRAKNRKNPELGKQLQKRKVLGMYTSTRHSADIEQHATISSVTEQTSLDEYLSNAQASRKVFEAERGYAAIQDLGVVPEDQEIDPNAGSDSEEEEDEADFCSIPKKPLHDENDTAETFQQREIDSFLKWKRSLSRLQAKNPKVNILAFFIAELGNVLHVFRNFNVHTPSSLHFIPMTSVIVMRTAFENLFVQGGPEKLRQYS